MSTPKISVIMPVYNEERFVGKAIESILTQTFTDFEFIIIDDGSTDDSAKIIKSYKDSRIKFFQSENRGISNQLNFGISNSTAPLIARMDADDISLNNRLEVQLNAFNEKPDTDVIGSNISYIDENGNLISDKKYPELHKDIEFMMPVESAICHPAVMMRKRILEEIGFYKSEYDSVEDHQLFLNLIFHGCIFYNIQQTLFKYRFRFIRRNISGDKDPNSISYKLGMDYLNKKLTTTSSGTQDEYNYYFRMALIEYYRGSMTRARRYFFKALLLRKDRIIKILRYILITLLGQKVVHLIRKKVFPKLSLFINRTMKIDFHRIGK